MDTTKTIKGLLDALAAIDAGVPMRYWRYSAEAIEEAIALLRAQEPVKPLDENYWKHTMGRCGHCKAPLPAIEGLRSKFCWMCGRTVKWE